MAKPVVTFFLLNSRLSSLVVHVHIAFVSTAHAHLPCGSRPVRILRLSTSAFNVSFVYPHGVTRSTYISQLPNPSDVWKAFNPALCKPHELPKLILLQDCMLQETPAPSSRVNEQTRLHNLEYSPHPTMTPSSPTLDNSPKRRGVSYDSEVLDTFRGYRFDIGAIDYRGQYVFLFFSLVTRFCLLVVPKHAPRSSPFSDVYASF